MSALMSAGSLDEAQERARKNREQALARRAERELASSSTVSIGIDHSRIKILNDKPIARGQFVLLWIQNDVRESFNHALEYAVIEANTLRLPLVAVYGLWEHFPEANERMFAFLVEVQSLPIPTPPSADDTLLGPA